jgi:DNA primase
MSDTVEQIKSRLDIVDVVSGYLKVQKSGANYKARCPFHNEKTPSFHISPDRQSWHCFGCNKGGDMFSFVQEIDGVEFVEAMRTLAAKAGVVLPAWRPEQARERDARGPLLAIAELSAKFFEKQLWHSNAGTKALAYLRERGLKDETITAWRLGWAPNDWRALTGFLQEQDHMPKDIVAAGMAVEKSSRIYDRFRSRIMFPICDANGQVAGFTGRVFGAEIAVDGEPLAKYVNTPQTALYDKSRILFGLDKAKLEMRRRDSCLLVEGNMDAIMAWQAGAANVVATSGTALTSQQLRMLSRYSTNLSICFDADQAGQVATRRGIGLALSQNFTISVLALTDPSCKDPADYVAAHGEEFSDVVASAKPVLQYYYDSAVAAYDPSSAQSKKSIVASMGPLIKRLTSKVEQSHWIGQLAVLLRTDPKNVQADLATIRDDIAAYEQGAEPSATSRQLPADIPAERPLDAVSQELLALVVKEPSLLPQAQEVPAELLDVRVAEVLKRPELLAKDAEHEYRHFVDVAFMRAGDLWDGWSQEDLKAELATVVIRLKERDLKVRLRELAQAVQQAETAHDGPKIKDLLEQFAAYTRELNRLQNPSLT